jgi:hypothetical protein
MLVFGLGFGQLVQFFDTDFWSRDGGDELEIALIGSREYFPQSG